MISEKVNKVYGERPAAYADYHDLLADKKVDAVLITAGWEEHAKIAVEAMRAGKGFKMEHIRPLAMDMDDSKFRPDHTGDEGRAADDADRAAGAASPAAASSSGCTACGAVSDEAVAAVAERLGEGVGR